MHLEIFMKRLIIAIGFVLTLIAGFQNCAMPTFGTRTGVSGNGDIYSGMIYVSRQSIACGDGSDIRSAIHGSSAKGFTLMRKDCVGVSPQRRLLPSEVSNVNETSIRYLNETLVSSGPSSGGWQWTISCMGQDVPGSFVDIPTTYNSAHRIEISSFEQPDSTAKAFASGEILYLDTSGATLSNVPLTGIEFTVPAGNIMTGSLTLGNATEYPIATVHASGVVPASEYLKPLSFLGRFDSDGTSIRLNSLYFLGAPLQRQTYLGPTRELRSLRIFDAEENPAAQAPWTTQCILLNRN